MQALVVCLVRFSSWSVPFWRPWAMVCRSLGTLLVGQYLCWNTKDSKCYRGVGRLL
jgi:hypothetical protein